MLLFEYFNKLERMDQLIRFRCTGSPSEFANKIQVSERQIYYLLGVMKDMDAPIAYNKTLKTYYYASPVTLKICFEKKQTTIN
ncbi:MAG: hypothetical protein ACEPOZ_13630 [Marinifilaceae bacterium]|jgi:hypothetical protein